MEALEAYLARPWQQHYAAESLGRAEIPLDSVNRVIDNACERFADHRALLFYGRTVRYRELREASDRMANALWKLGLRKGDRLALYLLNSPQFVIVYLAALKCGAIVTPISPLYTSREVRFQLEDSGAKAIVCQDILYDKVSKSGVKLEFTVVTDVSEYLPPLRRLLARGAGFFSRHGASRSAPRSADGQHGVHRYGDLLAESPAQAPDSPIDPGSDLAALPYTGGTTGHPKGVSLTHRNLVAAMTASQAAFPQLQPGAEVVLAFLPFFHIYGQVALMLSALARGHTLIVLTNADTNAILGAIDRHAATVFYAVPTLYEYLKDHEDTNKVDWRRLKVLVSGADTLHEATLEGWQRRTQSMITEGYGLSEAAAVCHVNPPGRSRPGSFGCPVVNLDSAVLDPATRQFVPPGTPGELLLSGPSVMRGYWNRDQENRDAFVEFAGKRWLRTGDIVRMDSDGYFYFYDRAKDLIKYKGYSIFAKDVEDVLYAHPQVKAAGVIGVDDPAVGQRIKAIVVPQPDARGKLNEESLLAYCREKLAEYKVPHVIEFRGELPKTDVGKVSRRELREE